MITKILFICLFASTFASVAEKYLLCPTPENTTSNCAFDCASEESCPAGQKCCFNGCGRYSCQTAINPCNGVICQKNKKCQVNPNNSTAICVDKYCGPVKECNCQTLVEYYLNYEGCLSCRCTDCNCSTTELAVYLPFSHGRSNKKCVCVDSCEEACPVGFLCEQDRQECIAEPCPKKLIPRCYPIPVACPYGQPLRTVLSTCCGGCDIHEDCPKGYECNTDPNYWYAPCCKIDPCNHNCTTSQRCELVKVYDKKTKRYREKPTCIPRECPLRKCAAKNCKYGYAFDENLCRTCSCLDPCKDKVCKHGKTCVPIKAPACPEIDCQKQPNCPGNACPEYYGLCV